MINKIGHQHMTENSKAEVSQDEASGFLAWFLSLRAIWKLEVIQLVVCLVVGIVLLIKNLFNL